MRVAEDGHVTHTLVARSDADIFNEAALEAARQWVFTPALMQQQPVAVWIVIEFHFSLRDAR
jgi:TonB family protein